MYNKIQMYDNLKLFSDKIYKELNEYKKEVPRLLIEIETYKKAYEEAEKQKEKYKNKLWESVLKNPDSIDNIEIPRLNIKQIETALKDCDDFLLWTIRELIRLDTWEIVKSLANALQKESKYEISISLNSIRRRNEAWLGMIDKAINTKTTYIDKWDWKVKKKK